MYHSKKMSININITNIVVYCVNKKKKKIKIRTEVYLIHLLLKIK